MKRSLYKRLERWEKFIQSNCGANGEIVNNYYFISEKIAYAKRKIKNDFSFPVCHMKNISEILKRYGYSISENEFYTEIRHVGLSDGELENLYVMMTVCCVKALYEICKYENGEKNDGVIISFMRKSEFFDYKRFFISLSKTEKELLKHRDYDISDEKTKAQYRYFLKKYARKKGVMLCDALKLLSGQNITRVLFKAPHPIARVLYFPIITAVFLALAASLGFLVLFPFSPYALIPYILCLFPLYECGVYLVNYSYSKLFVPFAKPSIKSDEISDDVKCTVVITALLDGDDKDLFAKLERYFLSNRRKNLTCGILADLPDSDTPTCEKDEKTLGCAKKEIDRLREKYSGNFFLYYRAREYSASEGRFIAPERKRGAVYELCKHLNGEESDIIVYPSEKSASLRNVKYLITLDEDTILPPGEAERMLCVAEHPLNQPVYDEEKHRVVSGHGILQPGVETSLSSALKNGFSLLTSGCVGVQVYRYARFDIYEEIFKQGIFCGKGIINTAVFCKAAEGMFPKEKILSHDIPEGCLLNAGMIPDMTFYDSTPSNAIAYHKRQNRWIRGDVQTLFAFGGKYIKGQNTKVENPLSMLDKYKLYDNVRRDLTPLFAFLTMVCGAFFERHICVAVAVFSLFYISMPFLVSSFECAVSGAFGVKRRFYSFTLSSFWYGFLSFLYRSAALAKEAYVSLRACAAAVWRYKISNTHLLEWVSATNAEKALSRGIGVYCLWGGFSLLSGILFMLVPFGIYRFTGVLFILYPFAMFLLSQRKPNEKRKVKEEDKKKIYAYVKDMWRYFDENVNEKSGFLPPDNISFAGGERVAERTSPTNIGMYLMSLLAVYDFGIINKEKLCTAVGETLTTVEKLKKYKGNLYNWYDTETLNTMDGFVSFVDSGNFLCCLICLREGMKEIPTCESLCLRIERLINETDLSCMFDKERNMFYIGLDERDGVTKQNHYDIYMSEARSADYYATARGITDLGVLSSTARIVIDRSGHIGLASWSGTAFEYFMPSLFLPTPQSSLLYEALEFACLSQMSYKACVKGGDTVYGTSESCFFEFDSEMNYQYKAHGVPSLGLKAGLSDDLVISPYSSFLMLTMGSFPLANLEALKKYGAYGIYGFYEAVDFTKSRVGDGYAVIKCFMAHHIGMSIAACANFVFDNIFVKRFTSDLYVDSSLCLLSEKIPTDTPPYRSQKIYDVPALPKYRNTSKSERSACGVISNSLLRCDIAPNGNVYLHYGDAAVWDGQAGKLRFDVYKDGKVYGLIGSEGVCDGVTGEFAVGNGEKYVASAKLSISELQSVFCLECAFDEGAQGLLSFSPVLESESRYTSHISYSRLFISAKMHGGVLILKRKGHAEERNLYMSLCVCDDFGIIPFEYEISADKILPFDPEKYMYDTLEASAVDTEYISPITPFVLVKTDKPHTRILFAFGKSESDALRAVHSASVEKDLTRKNKEGIKRLYSTVLHCTYSDEGIVSALLCRDGFESARQSRSHLGTETLWKYGISGDFPILTLDLTDEFLLKAPPEKLLKAVYTHKTLLIKGHRYDTVILYKDEDKYNQNVRKRLIDIFKKAGVLPLVGRKNGIFAVMCQTEEERDLFTDMSFYPTRERKNVLHGEIMSPQYAEKRTYSVSAQGVEITNGYGVLPWSFIYSNENFGTLLTQNSLGYTWCENSRMGKLTRFESDILNINGEDIILELDGKLYPLTRWAEKTVFGFYDACYSGRIKGIAYSLNVICHSKEKQKLIKLTLTNRTGEDLMCEAAYKADFVLGEHMRENGRLFSRKSETSLKLVNAYSGEVPECTLCSPQGKITSFNGVTGCVRCPLQLTAYSSSQVYFSLGCGVCEVHMYNRELAKCKEAAEAFLNVFELDTGDKSFDLMFNRFSKYQALYCRVYARCGFYQNGGAYGFRDQLQDMICIMYSAPEVCREHLLRCAAHQYEQGDVAHWWHMGKVEKGIRTRCSDDMLWLIYVCARYVRMTGDDSVLFTPVGYINSPILGQNEKDRYETLAASDVKESLYMHCVRAVGTVKYGEHGLPLFGSGDWNDGMNNVGGESVWLGWFLCGVLRDMAYLAQISADKEGKEKYEAQASILYENIEKFAFNGEYYIRGTFSDGTVIGKTGGCDIDVLPQAFAAMNGAEVKRVESALDAVWKRLYDKENKQLLLFSPPFDEVGKYAGYICDYPKGVRENGGQYTHGAVWGAMGFFRGNMPERGFEVLRAINPLIRCENKEASEKYKGEPYVFAGDVYSNPHTPARCGWSWYTGAAGWYFTAVLEELLGYKETEYGFTINPNFCNDLKKFTLTIRKKGTVYAVEAKNAAGETVYPFDGEKHVLNI